MPVRDGLGRYQRVLVLGGGSDIALATVRRLLAAGTRDVLLAARHPERLAPDAARLRALGAAEVTLLDFDAAAPDTHEGFVERAFAGGDLDLVLLAFGVLGPDRSGQRDHAAALEVVLTNYVGAVSVLLPLAARLQAQGHGTIVALSSVSAERARAANYVYGSSKAGLDAFCQGLGDDLAGDGIGLLVVRPGYVHTKMTAGRPPAPLATTPDAVAAAIVAGLQAGAHTVWVPRTLRPATLVLRALPRPIFRRLPV